MNKFGLLDEDDSESSKARKLTDQIAAFPPVRPRPVVDLAASDAAAAQHGFVSREASLPFEMPLATRRRRAVPSEPTRHLAIRLTASAYERFVAYADRYRLTYHDALTRLMDGAGE
jgi:hypothetical protein